MSSQFDALLDFGNDPPPNTNGTAQNTNGTDDFDPFGPSPGGDKSGAVDSGLLLDFSVTTEVSSKQENGTSDPFDTQFTVTASTDDSSSNLFMDISSTETQSSSANPFYDMSTTDTSTSQSANPLYDLMDEDFVPQSQPESQSANPLYDMSENDSNDFTFETTVTTTTTIEEKPGVNPLYDFADQEEVDGKENAEDSLQVEVELEKSTSSEDVQASNSFQEEDQVVPEVTQQQESGPREFIEEEEETTQQTYQEEEEPAGQEQNVELFIREEREEQAVVSDAGGVAAAVDVDVAEGDDDDADSTKGRRRSRSRSPSRSRSISSEREVLNEEEELRQDGHMVYKAREEQSYTDTGFGSSGPMREEYGAATTGGVQNGTQREDFHFSEMSSVKSQFERGPQESTPQRRPVDIREEVAHSEGGVYESQPATFQPQYDDEPEEGVYENQPQQRPDLARESDRNIGAELPSIGTAKSMKEKFLKGEYERSSGIVKREAAPPDVIDGGVYENQPQYNPDVVHAGEQQQEQLPEQGYARNIAGRFKELEKQGSVPSPHGRREITPDRSGKVEYVSEPRGQVERYEGHAETGVFESQPRERADVVRSDQLAEEILPERGTAKNVAERFKQMSSGTPSPAPRGKRELTPDTSGRVEYVSEPRGRVETYEGKAESGVFESQPAEREDVVKSDQLSEEILPERGAAKNIAAKFREMEKGTKSPPSPSKFKEFTPPRENGSERSAGVYESNPTRSPDVVTSEEHAEEILPERGTAKNLVNRFRQLSSGDSNPAKSPRAKKEFTPPPQEGVVFENNPRQFIADYNRPAESGILESTPEVRQDVVRGDEPPKYEEELPERGFTRNLVSAWRQRETESAKISPTASGKPKEFTPPREEPRVAQQRPAPRTPKSPAAGAGLSEGSVHPMDLPGQYQPQEGPSVFESEPQRRDDVVREDDTDWAVGMPKPDTTKKMLAKFRNIQAEASKESPRPQPTGRKAGDDSSDSTLEQVVRSKSMRVAVQLEKCGACQKTVYAMEKIEIEKNAYHKNCFRCSHCQCVLTPKTFAVNNRVMYCTNHYKQLFATKGNYDEGFGRDQHKKRWKSESNLADGQTENDTQH